MIKKLTLLLAGLLAAQISLTATDIPSSRMIELPQLTEKSSWEIKPDSKEILSLIDRKNWLEVGFRCQPDDKGYLLLKKPIPIPDWVTGMNFYSTNNGPLASFRIMIMVTDANGNDYLYHTNSLHSFKYGMVITEHTTRRCREMQFSVPGLDNPRLVGQSGATITSLKSRKKPVRPLTMKGLFFEGIRRRSFDKRLPLLYFRDFSFNGLSVETSKRYYLFDDQPFYSEINPLPYITPGQFRIWWGKKFDVTWEACKEYSGQPFLTGRYVVDLKKGELPTELKLAKHIEIPITGRGTWWVRVKLRRWKSKDTGAPDQISQFEYRLYVHKGKKAAEVTPIPANTPIPGDYVRIAPARKSLIFTGHENFIVPVQFTEPENKAAATCKVEVRRGVGGTLVKEFNFKPEWDKAGIFTAQCDLKSFPPGAYEITGLLLTGGKVFDKTIRMVGKQAAAATKHSAVIPASVPSAKEAIYGKEPMFVLCPIPPTRDRYRLQVAWDKHLKPFLDHAGQLSKDIELQISWKTVEPLPGVYDWSAIDRFVNYAGKKGLRVILQPEFRAWNTPEWVPSYFEENPEGTIVGHGGYTFHGGRPNLLNSPIRHRILAFIERLVERYRSNPAVLGYFTCVEHPGDAPYKGWYEGYSPESREMFIDYCRKKWHDLKALNKRWNSNYKSWSDIDHPRGKVSERQYLDWLQFRINSVYSFYKDIVLAIRVRDPKRLIIMYGVGHDIDWFKKHGCMSANGGSHDTMQMLSYARFGFKNFSQRTEDHSPGNWSAYFPTQMDASVYAMMTGGGVNTHVKAFIRPDAPWKQYMDIKSKRGRYRRFMPIWRELRNTECLPIKAFVFNSVSAYLAAKKTTYFGWYSNPWMVINFNAAHVPVCHAGPEDWEKGKLVMLTDKRPILEKKELDKLVDYVKNGGTLAMEANYGRQMIEDPKADWTLIKRLGFKPPVKDEMDRRQRKTVPVPGKIFPTTAKPFTLRGTWQPAPDADAHIAACFDGNKNQPAITWKKFGKGKVAVIWANTIVPPMNTPYKYAFLRDIAKWAGVPLYSNASNDLIWTNLLKSKDSDTYFGLAYVATWQHRPKNTVTGSVQWLVLPAGNYEVTELISGKKIGNFSAQDLKLKGINVKLKPKELAIYKMVRK